MPCGVQALAGVETAGSWVSCLCLLPSFNQHNFEQGVTKAVGESWLWWNGQNPGRIPVSIREQEGARLACSLKPSELLSLVSLERE